MDVAVLGTSETGRALAGWCVQAEVAVRLYGEDANAVMDSVDAVQRRAGAGTREAIDGTTGLDAAVSGADVVVDATDRETEDRRTLLAEAEELIDEETLVAICDTHDTITAVAAGLRWPGRAIGLHVVAPDDEFALRTALTALGGYDPETVRVVWIRNTQDLADLRVSAAVVGDLPDAAEVVARESLTFEDGTVSFGPRSQE